MRNKFFLAMLLVAVIGFVGCAQEAAALEEFDYDKSKVVVSVENSYEEKNIDDIKQIGVSIGKFSGGIDLVTSDVKVNTMLVKLGYELSEFTTPYVLLGYGRLSFDQDYQGSISGPGGSIGTSLLRQEYREGAFAYGVGLEGDLAQYKGVVVGYDLRWVRFAGEETDESIELVPDLISGLSIGNKVEAGYDEVSGTLLASKEYNLKKEPVEGEEQAKVRLDSITPFVGYRASLVAIDLKSSVNVWIVGVSNEADIKQFSNDGVLGFKAVINDDITIKLAGVAGDSFGGSASVNVKF